MFHNHSFRVRTLLFVGSILLVVALSCSQSTIKDTVITAENQAELAQRLATELSYEEATLLQSYVSRNHPDLEEGQLPVGGTIQQMLDAERLHRSQIESADSTVTTLETDESQPTAPAKSAPAPQPKPATRTRTTPEAGDKRVSTPAESVAQTEPAPEPKPVPTSAQKLSPAEEPKVAPKPVLPTTATVSSGTQLEVRLNQSLSSKVDRSGETFEAELEEDLKVGNDLVAPAGSLVTGRIVSAKPSGKVKGRAQMSLTLKSVSAGDEEYPLETNQLNFEAESDAKRDAGRIAIGTGIGAAIGAIAGGGKGAAIGAAIGGGGATGATMMTPGKEVEFSVEQLFVYELQSDVEMKILR
jgi:outer membrane biosynthesis protein TonB